MSDNSTDSLSVAEQARKINAHGHFLMKGVYDRDDINRVREDFDKDFMQRLANNEVQSRDYNRFVCKLPISKTYEPVLNNPAVHALLTELLGEGYVLFNFNSHSALPGSTRQVMHVDSIDPNNTNTYVSSQTNVAFLHIPMIDAGEEHGVTGMWPIVLYRKAFDDFKDMKWIKDNVPAAQGKVEMGDVYIKLDSCVHAGGANQSNIRRHMVTLIFARKHFYLTENSGMVPCQDYKSGDMPELPYTVLAHCDKNDFDTTKKFECIDLGKPQYSLEGVPQSIEFHQFYYGEKVLPQPVFRLLKAMVDEQSFDANRVFNVIDYLLPLLKASFGSMNFRLHSVRSSGGASGLDCDSPRFKAAMTDSVYNNAIDLLTVRIPLENRKDWLTLYAGNRNLSRHVLNGIKVFDDCQKSFDACEGDVLINTGESVYSNDSDVPALEFCFVHPSFIPSYDDRYRVNDDFAISLPNHLGKLLRYDAIYITNERRKSFQFNRLGYYTYRIFNQIQNYRMEKPVLGTLALGGAVITLAPLLIYFASRKHIPTQLKAI